MAQKNLAADTLTMRRKEDWFMDGYGLELLTEADPTPNANERSVAIFGLDDDLSQSDPVSTAISLTATTPDGRKAMERIVQGLDPTDTVPAYIDPARSRKPLVWCNVKQRDNVDYEMAYWFGEWAPPGIGTLPAGADADTAETWVGTAKVQRNFIGAYIASQLATSFGQSGTSWTGTLGTAFIAPNNSAVAEDWTQTHLGIILISGTDASTIGDNPNLYNLPYRDGAVSTTTLTLTVEDTDQLDDTVFTHCLVVGPIAAASAGTYPSTTPNIECVTD